MNCLTIPRTLVISNNCFSSSNSNGRTMMNFFRGADPACLAQIYISGKPEAGFCDNYFQITDREALYALLPFGRYYYKKKTADRDIRPNQEYKPRRNCRNLFLRDIVWKTGRWKSPEFRRFLKNFRPQAVVLQAGDAPFMYRMANQVSKTFHAPLVIYNSEGYVLKDVLYASASDRDPWHKLFQHRLRTDFSRSMKIAGYCVYNTEYLDACYRTAYPNGPESCTLYTVSDLHPLPAGTTDPFTLLYCGNMGVGRAQTLDEIASVLDKMDFPVYLDLYGTFSSPEEQVQVISHTSVRWHGTVPYNELIEKMAVCTMLLHCENENRVINLAHAFSTKIADCLASGKPFLVYATDQYPFVQYLQRHRCAHIVSDPGQLEHILHSCLDPAFLNQYRSAALHAAAENHAPKKNASQMAQILFRVIQNRSQSDE